MTASSPLHALDTPCAISPGTWCEIPGTRMSEVFPSLQGHPAWGIMGPRAVTAAWGGGAFDTKRHKLVITGGGHGDYGGNEVYEFELAARKWKRATEPSRMRELKDGEFAVEEGEAPVSSHTYGGLAFVPNIDRVFKFGGSYYKSGNAYDKHAYLYNTETRAWSRRAEAPQRVLTPVADFDAKTGRVFVVSGPGLLSYDPMSDSWKALLARDSHEVINAGAIDHGTRRFVVVGRHGELAFYDLDNIRLRQRAPLKGKVDWGHRVGLAYHPPSGQLVLWEGGREVWTVDATTWEVCKIGNRNSKAPTVTTSSGQVKSQGVYGRWRYIPSLNLFIGYNDSNDNVWLYQLALDSGASRSKARPPSCE
jgi:hypothetical protein